MKALLKMAILVLTSNCICFSQVEWAPQNAKWVYSDYITNSANPTYTTIELIGDTVIQNITNKILRIENIFECSGIEETIYTYQTSDNKIFAKLNGNDEHKMIYDFNALEGDTWDIPIQVDNVEDTLTYEINAVTIINDDGIERRVYNVSRTYKNNLAGFNLPSEILVEGIGDLYFITAWQSQNCNGNLYHKHLSCYSDIQSSFIRIPEDTAAVCNDIISSINNVQISNLKDKENLIYPNPSTGVFTVKNEYLIEEFEIFEINGKLIKRDKLKSNQIDISNQANGIYFVRLLTKDNTFIYRKIIKN